MTEINLVTFPDYDHNSDHKISLIADTPLAVEILDVIEEMEQLNKRVSITCITSETTDFDWIATTVNSSDFTFINTCTKQDNLIIGWILGRPNVWHNIKKVEKINAKYSSSILTAYIKHLHQEEENTKNGV